MWKNCKQVGGGATMEQGEGCISLTFWIMIHVVS